MKKESDVGHFRNESKITEKKILVLLLLLLLLLVLENRNWVNIGQIYQTVYCDLMLSLGGTPLGKNLASTFAPKRNITSNV